MVLSGLHSLANPLFLSGLKALRKGGLKLSKIVVSDYNGSVDLHTLLGKHSKENLNNLKRKAANILLNLY